MKIALDYDDTFTRDVRFWTSFINKALGSGHDIRIVTSRHHELDIIPSEHYECPVIYCDGVAKQWWCHHYEDFDPDVWIDDKPKSIIENSSASKEWLAEWRVTREG